jgi:hypothetical protein
LVVAASFTSGCHASQLQPSSDASFDGPGDFVSGADGPPPFLPLQSCGGTVTGSGTSPTGAFSAGSVYAVVVACSSEVEIFVYDAAGYARLTFTFSYTSDAGTVDPSGLQAANAYFDGPPRGARLVTSAGSVDVTTATDPAAGVDAGVAWGMIGGTFSAPNDGLAISGSFSTPYCLYSAGVGCQR